jgi:anionic cell wall polymer biosynthesis LytR-Cps2A-Psr (LCP) family protein
VLKKRIVTITAAAAVIIAALVIYNAHSIYTRNVIDNLVSQKRMINILIAGSNAFNNSRHRFYGIVSVNPENKKIGFTFIPPNMKLDLDGKGKNYQKIEDIDISDFNDISASLERNLNLKIPFYVELYSPDIIRVIDLIEGIDLFVLDQIKNDEGVSFGLRYLDGKKVVKYINTSENNSIFRKYDRVEDILLSMYYNKDKYAKFSSIEFISEAIKSIKTNILPQEVMSLMKLVFQESELVCSLIPGEFDDSGYYFMDNIAYKIFEKEFLTRLFLIEKANPAIKVKILNGTDIPGLARKMRNIMIRDGRDVSVSQN